MEPVHIGHSRVVQNTAWLGGSKAVEIVLSFVYSIYITRYLGPNLVGIMATAMAWVAIAGFATDLGLGTLLTRDVARDRQQSTANRYFVNVLLLKILLATLAYVVMVVLLLLFRYSAFTMSIALVLGIGGVVLAASSSTFMSSFRAFERMEFEAAWAVAKRCLLLLGGAIVVMGHWGLLELALTHLIVALVELVYFALVNYRRFFPIDFSALGIRFWPYLLRGGLPLGVVGLVQVIYNRVDTLMLSLLRDSAEVGLYNVALTFRTSLVLFPTVILSALFPTIAAAFGSRQVLQAIYAKGFKVLLGLGLPMAAGIALLARPLILSLYGEQFLSAAPVLQVLIWATAISFLQQLFVYAMMATELGRQCAVLLLVGLVVNVALNALLIPPLGMAGAATATLAAECAMTLAAYVFLVRQVGYFPVGLSILHSAVGVLAMAGFILLLQRLALLWYLIIPAAAFVYCTVFVLIGGVSKGERQLLRTFIRRALHLTSE